MKENVGKAPENKINEEENEDEEIPDLKENFEEVSKVE